MGMLSIIDDRNNPHKPEAWSIGLIPTQQLQLATCTYSATKTKLEIHMNDENSLLLYQIHTLQSKETFKQTKLIYVHYLPYSNQLKTIHLKWNYVSIETNQVVDSLSETCFHLLQLEIKKN